MNHIIPVRTCFLPKPVYNECIEGTHVQKTVQTSSRMFLEVGRRQSKVVTVTARRPQGDRRNINGIHTTIEIAELRKNDACQF